MKASQLRAASQLIESLDKLNTDLSTIATAVEPHVVVRFGSKQLHYRPPIALYKEQLIRRREAVEKLLRDMGVDVTT